MMDLLKMNIGRKKFGYEQKENMVFVNEDWWRMWFIFILHKSEQTNVSAVLIFRKACNPSIDGNPILRDGKRVAPSPKHLKKYQMQLILPLFGLYTNATFYFRY